MFMTHIDIAEVTIPIITDMQIYVVVIAFVCLYAAACLPDSIIQTYVVIGLHQESILILLAHKGSGKLAAD